MAGNMFQDVVCPQGENSRKWYALPLSFLVHTSVLAIVIVAPLVATDVLPAPRQILNFMMTPSPTMPAVVVRQQKAATSTQVVSSNAAPVEPPTEVGRESGLQTVMEERVNTSVDGIVNDLGADQAIIDAPPPQALRETGVAPVHVGGVIKVPARIKDVAPVYPEIARSARVQGVVILEATIGTNGKVERARILRSVPLLDQAALNAVQSWEYTPTLLNGVPVPVIMTVTVNFKLE